MMTFFIARAIAPFTLMFTRYLFAVIDELCDAYETDAFHAGMDEIFYLGDDKCPRCQGVDKANFLPMR